MKMKGCDPKAARDLPGMAYDNGAGIESQHRLDDAAIFRFMVSLSC